MDHSRIIRKRGNTGIELKDRTWKTAVVEVFVSN